MNKLNGILERMCNLTLGHVTLWHFVPDSEARENHPSIRFEDPFQIEFATSTSQLHGIEYH